MTKGGVAVPNDAHSHTVAGQDRVVEYARDDQANVTTDTGLSVPYGNEVAVQEYVDHADRPTTVREYDSGRVDVFVGNDQPGFWGA